MTSTLPPVLSIAGSDSSGGAGIQADLKTMLANGVFGMTAIAALTAQNTTGVTMVTNTPVEMLAAQIDAVFDDIPPVAVKIGMVSSVELINVIADRLTAHDAENIVLDPVMVATSGAKLIEDDAIAALTSKLFPLATVITPNMPETQALCELAVEQGADAIADDSVHPVPCVFGLSMRRARNQVTLPLGSTSTSLASCVPWPPLTSTAQPKWPASRWPAVTMSFSLEMLSPFS